MRRAIGLALVLCTIAVAQDKKPDDKKPDDPVKVTGHLPQNWGKLGLSADQKTEVYKINAKYATKIDKLKAEIDALKAQEETERLKVLSEDQKKKLKEIKSGEKPAPAKPPVPDKSKEK